MREYFQPVVNQIATTKPNTHEQEKTAALVAFKVIQGYANNLGINDEKPKNLQHQPEAP
ncbi:MAG: hypothetical protein HYY22_05300 [Thaumarchaeota archaeon]|nr:hypothetical protein [Nitrososphaerota archaeon]